MIWVRLLTLDSLTEQDTLSAEVSALPFGKSEVARLKSLTQPSTLRQSLGALLALKELTDRRALGQSLSIVRDADGKPHFDDPTMPDFNLSHTDTLVAAALGDEQSGSVGIDVQLRKNLPHSDSIAKRFFSSDEQKKLAERIYGDDTFFVLWTKKEAVAKQSGKGILADRTTAFPKKSFNRSYRLTLSDQTAYLTVSAEHPIKTIEIFYDKEISLYELPN